MFSDAPGRPRRLMGPKPGPVSSMLLSQFPKSKMSTGIPKGLGKRKVLKKKTGIEEWSNLTNTVCRT